MRLWPLTKRNGRKSQTVSVKPSSNLSEGTRLHPLRDQYPFASPASTSLDELVGLREMAQALRRNSRRKSAAPSSGPAASRRLGRGLDFAEVRDYQAGDDVRNIDWKVTARTGKAHTKLFVEERERPVMFIVDFRSHMRFGTQGMFKSVMAARLAALLGWTANINQDRVGGFVFTDDWHTEIRPRSGRHGLMALFRGIAEAQMHAPSGDTGQLADTLKRLRSVVHAGSTAVVLSDFIGFDDKAKSAMGKMLSKLDLQVVHIVDPLECQLPVSGRYPVKGVHAQANESLTIDTGSKNNVQRYLKKHHEHRSAVADFFTSHGHLYVSARTDQALLDIAGRVLSRIPDRANDVQRKPGHNLGEPVGSV